MGRDREAFRKRFLAYKNGKSVREIYDAGLPRYAEGKVDLKDNPTNATVYNDGTFVDDYTRAFEDLVVTPQGSRVKPGSLYKYQEPWDDEKFINAVTLGGLNNLSPAQLVGRIRDLQNGNLTAESWLYGNSGVVPAKYAQEHPLGALAANTLFDFWVMGGPSIVKNAKNYINIAKSAGKTSFKLTPYTLLASQEIRRPASITLRNNLDQTNLHGNISLIQNENTDVITNRMAGIRPATIQQWRLVPPAQNIPASKSLVNEDGTVNIRNVVEKMRDFYDMEPNAKNYKDIRNSSGNLFQHINDVVKSAQNIPVPTGYTRKDLVEAALYHDIGKVLNSSRSHDKTSVEILNKLGINTSPTVKNAVAHHMSRNMLDKDNLTRALHFADVARGMKFPEAAFRFPHLLYDRLLPKLSIKPLSVELELKTRINPWLRRKGYDQINPKSTQEEALEQLQDRIIQHRSLERGVRDPLKVYSQDPNNRRNAINAAKYVAQKYNISFEEALDEQYANDRLEYAGTTIPINPTGSGRSNLFTVSGKPSVHRHTKYSELLGANPKTKDGLYVSTSDDVKNNYATSTDSRPGLGYIVTLPIQEMRPGESMSEWLLRNDWELYNTEKLEDSPIGTASMYEDPYRLQTGRSLVSDMKEAGILKPKYKRNYDNVLFPGDNPPNQTSIRTGKVLRYNYQDVLNEFRATNKRLKDAGIDYEFTPFGENEAIVDPRGKMDLMSKINRILNFNDSIGPDDLEIIPTDPNDNFMTLNPYLSASYMDAAEAYTDDVFRLSMADHIIPNELYDPEAFFEGGMPEPYKGKIEKIKHHHRNPLSKDVLLELETSNLISPKQSMAIKRLFRAGVDARKYLNADRIVHKMLDKYFTETKGRKYPAHTLDKSSFTPSAEDMYKFMKERGVLPKYDIEGFNEHAVYAVKAPEKNKTKNQKLSDEIYGYILGDKGQKVVQPSESTGYRERKAGYGQSRDYGERTNEKLTRKTLRTLSPIIVGGAATLQPKRNKDGNKE